MGSCTASRGEHIQQQQLPLQQYAEAAVDSKWFTRRSSTRSAGAAAAATAAAAAAEVAGGAG